MIAFGGAAPAHAGRLCEKLGIDRLIVPPGAGVGSAIGFLRAPFSFEATKSLFMTVSAFDGGRAQALLASLEHEASTFVQACGVQADIVAERRVYMRYAGQGFEIPVVLPAAVAESPAAESVTDLFESAYAALFGRTVAGMDIEITVWAVNAATVAEPVTAVEPIERAVSADSGAERRLFEPALSEFVRAAAHDRDTVGVGSSVAGPALIVERETTTVIPSSRKAIVQADGCVDVRRVD